MDQAEIINDIIGMFIEFSRQLWWYSFVLTIFSLVVFLGNSVENVAGEHVVNYF